MKALPIIIKNRQDLLPEYHSTVANGNLLEKDSGPLKPTELRKFIRDMRIKRAKILQDWN